MDKIWVIAAGIIASLILVAELTGVLPDEIITGAETALEMVTDISTTASDTRDEELVSDPNVKPITEEVVDAAESAVATATTPVEEALYYVVRIVDGDTVEVERNGEFATVRYIGIDAPELERPNQTGECYATESKFANARLVHGMPVRLERDVSDTDEYGRLLRYVYHEDTFINQALVLEGFAEATAYNPDVTRQGELDAAETVAVDANRGMWSDVCAQSHTQ